MNKKGIHTKKRKRKIIPDKAVPVKRLKAVSLLAIIIFALLILRLFWIQFIEGASLKEKASRQQTSSTVISPKRGCIYDVNGKALSISEEVDTVSVNPSKIKEKDKETVAHKLADIFSLKYEEVLEKIKSTSPLQTIAKKVEVDKVKELQQWMAENKLSEGINIDADTKRVYPYKALASQVIGFCGTDNQGLAGIEASYDDILTGRSGKIITTADLNHSEISSNHKTYVEAEDGSDVYLTIDVNLQTIVEKYISKAVKNKKCETAGAIAMDPATGNILSMATYPNFNLNKPFEPVDSSIKKKWDSYSTKEKSDYLNKMWRNKNVSDLYEPGSTFKTLVSSIALEENITEVNVKGDFYCKAYQEFSDGTKIRCWSEVPHGSETLTQALANSCNPAFMQLGKRIGVTRFYKYFDAYGLFDKTGISLPGESGSIFFQKNKVGPVELATMSFGQRFEITPLQLITAVSSLANGGKLLQPQIVNKTVNKATSEVSNTQVKQVRQVVSEETANAVIKMMENVVTDGTGKKGAVKGYTIAGKTGTSEPKAGSHMGNTLSYIAVAPSENPQLVLLVVLYNTPTKDHGSTVAGPIVSKILKEALPYFGVNSDDARINTSNNLTSVPNVTNKTVTEAEKILTNAGFKTSTGFTGNKNATIVATQVPVAKSTVAKGSTVILYTEDNSTRTSVTVPNLKGMSLSKAKKALEDKKLNINYSGSGLVTKQSVKAGDSVEEGTVIEVRLSY